MRGTNPNKDPKGIDTLTWEEIVGELPELETLKQEFHLWSSTNKSGHLDNLAWPLVIKPILNDRIGWWAKEYPRGHKMRSPEAWRIALNEIYQKAPIPQWVDPQEDYAREEDRFVSSISAKKPV